MKVIAFNGSPRRDGNTALLLGTVLDVLKSEGIETELVQLGGKPVYGCRACYACFTMKNGRCAIADDEINTYLEKIAAADGILVGSPTYFANVTAEVKAFIDRVGLVSRANEGILTRKAGAAVVAVRRAGATAVFDAINKLFLINQVIVPGSSYWNLAMGREKGEVSSDEEGIRTMKTLGQNMAWLLGKIRQ